MAKIKLSEKDKANIYSLAAIYDAWISGATRNAHQTINIARDVDQLLHYGFKYGITRGSLFGTDKDGCSWQIAAVDMRPSHNNGRFHSTTWYKIDDRGVRHKVLPGLKWGDFYTLFGEKKNVRV